MVKELSMEEFEFQQGLQNTDNQSRREFSLDEVEQYEFNEPAKELNYFDSIKESLYRGNMNHAFGLKGFDALLAANVDKADETYLKVKKERDTFNAGLQRTKLKDDKWYENLGLATAQMIPGIVRGYGAGVTTGGAAAFATLATGPGAVTAPVAFAIGEGLGSTAEWYRQGAGELYMDLRDDGIANDIAVPVSHVAGLMYGSIERMQFNRFIPGGKKYTKGLIKESIKKAIGKLAIDKTKNWAEQVGQEALQEAIMTSAKEISEGISGKTDETMGNKVFNVIDKSWKAAVQSMGPMAILGLPGATMDAVNVKSEIKKATPKEELAAKIDSGDATLKEIVSALKEETQPQEEVEGTVPSLETKKYKTADEFVKSQTIMYHGGKGGLETKGSPKFFSSEKSGAAWYANERGDGTIHEAYLDIKNPASQKDIESAARSLNLTEQQMQKLTEYPYDLVYEPKVVEELKRRGFDGVEGWDVLENTEIPIKIVFDQSQIKTKKQLIDIWNKENNAFKNVQQANINKSISSGKQVTAGLALSTEEQAIMRGLDQDFGELPTYEMRDTKVVAKRASEMLETDYQGAKRIALRETPETNEIRAEELFTALRVKALGEGDFETLRELGLSEKASKAATELGQRIQALDLGVENDPVRAMRELSELRKEEVTKKIGKKKMKLHIETEVKKIKKSIKAEAKILDWNGFLDSIEC